MRALIATLMLISCTVVSAAQPEPAVSRFSGSATLSEPKAESADQRFVIDARLQANQTQTTGRFVLKSHLVPHGTDGAAFCGPRPNEVFRNGFEGV